MKRAIKPTLAGLVAAVTVVGRPAVGQELQDGAVVVVAPPEFQVMRAGDTQLSCEALRTEQATLEAELEGMQSATNQVIAGLRPRSRAMPGREAAAVATAVGGAVIPGAGLIIAAAGNQAMMAGRESRYDGSTAILEQHLAGQAEARTQVTARIDHLIQIALRKRC